MYIQIVGGRIYTPTGWIDGGSVLVEGKKIKAILNTRPPLSRAHVSWMLEARTSSWWDRDARARRCWSRLYGRDGRAFRTASDYHLQQGTTTIFPTLSTSSYETIMKGIECTEVLMKDDESTVEVSTSKVLTSL